jgi:hypothetical protein
LVVRYTRDNTVETKWIRFSTSRLLMPGDE